MFDEGRFRLGRSGGSVIIGRCEMGFEKFSFGSIRIDGVTYERDVVIDRGQVRKR